MRCPHGTRAFIVIMNGNNKIVHFLSASDRINYGDLLFPILFEKFAETENFHIKFYNYGVVKSNLSHYGALPTQSYLKLLKNVKSKGGKLVVGGGEVFFANWRVLYSFINPMYVKLCSNNYFKRMDDTINLPKYILSRNKVNVPFCPSKEELSNTSVKIYFSSVGGEFNDSKESDLNKKLFISLKTSALLSVRDKRTLLSMRLMGLDAKLIPDSAIIMSDVFKKESLFGKISLINFKVKDYIFLQLGRFKGPENLKQFVEDLKKLSNSLNLKVVLCPIGKALKHEDDILLKKVKEMESDFHYINPKNIYDVMFLIANASLYLGTSLHGVITAQSFNVPFVGLNTRLKKVESYIQTWVDDSMVCLPFGEVGRIESIYGNWDFKTINSKTAIQKEVVKENLRFILND